MSTNPTTNYPFDAIFDRMLGLSRQMDNAFSGRAFGTANATRPQLWLPPVDTYETEHAFVIEADLPGLHQENIDVHFEQGTLTLTGRRGPTLPAAEQGKLRVYSSERLSGAFSRSIRLPEYVDGEKIEATYSNGVLTVRVPKLAAALPRKISVAVNASDAKQIQG
ncbi:heat shock protein Hsp20 [Gemmatirosa kalamazoonensis]|uniref:Heat shock protein Hsp20 n=1 Tax=Gemmatirosa kalamazoonensis TaxID=861299 RepID=W0RHW6_9BACT|nr:Hsp20/alpha crystallin family protein [Gemmatirosa kalamazoonensis]AHG89925.1 heat shock protein Hsp20 [Gemmatirosa kalamazoonensis]